MNRAAINGKNRLGQGFKLNSANCEVPMLRFQWLKIARMEKMI